MTESEQVSTEDTGPKRVPLPSEELNVEQFTKLWRDQEEYINHLEEKLAENAKIVDDKTKADSTRRENLLVMRLTAKEQELQELSGQVAELKALQAPSATLLRSTLLDPATNLVIQKLSKECDNLKKVAEDKQNELSAWKFTADSATGKRLMAKCRQLYQENEDLGKMIASGRLAKLEGELALQKNLSDQMKQNQLEMDDFIAEMDEDVEGMQSTILYLQQQLREAKDKIAQLSAEKSVVEKSDQVDKTEEKPIDREEEDRLLKADDDEEDQVYAEENQDVDTKKDNVEGEVETSEDVGNEAIGEEEEGKSEKRKLAEVSDMEDEDDPEAKRSKTSPRTSE